MMVLALDMATKCGWAAGRTGETPTWGSRDFSDPDGNAAVLSKFRFWLSQRIVDLRPSLICFLSPYIPLHQRRKEPSGPPPMNMATIQRLIGFVNVTEMICWEQQIEVRSATDAEVMKFFTGAGRFPGGRAEKKARTVEMCMAYGWDVEGDTDAADSLGLFAKAEAVIDRKAAARRRSAASPILEQSLETQSAPRDSSPRGTKNPTRRGVSSNGPRQQQFTIF